MVAGSFELLKTQFGNCIIGNRGIARRNNLPLRPNETLFHQTFHARFGFTCVDAFTLTGSNQLVLNKTTQVLSFQLAALREYFKGCQIEFNCRPNVTLSACRHWKLTRFFHTKVI